MEFVRIDFKVPRTLSQFLISFWNSRERTFNCRAGGSYRSGFKRNVFGDQCRLASIFRSSVNEIQDSWVMKTV